jgi:hypothetical protein
LILLLKITGWIIEYSKKGRPSDTVAVISEVIGRSLFNVLFISSLYIFTAAFGATLSLNLLCHVTAWVFIAELNRIFCGLFKKSEFYASLELFGISVETILIAGQLIRFLGINFYDFI